ncbi:hypothetical protein Q4491_20740 [Photobacterium sp. 2_MG-2023]|nr:MULTISPECIES: hypothetical protein [Photobacterium]MDO6583766.1 hypothetical protein [Photobacterium sp. 2_MG-2023]
MITLAVLAAVAWLVGYLFRDLGQVSEAQQAAQLSELSHELQQEISRFKL